VATIRAPQDNVKHPYITRKQGVCGGKPVIVGTRIKVSQIAIEYNRMGWSADEIVQAHPHLTLAQIHDALSYYYDHLQEINTEIREGEQLIEELRKQYPRSAIEGKLGGASDLHQ
jgi:uncharacterized protein (DUF433 family)